MAQFRLRYGAFTKAGQKKAFRAGFKAGDTVTVQILIMDNEFGRDGSDKYPFLLEKI